MVHSYVNRSLLQPILIQQRFVMSLYTYEKYIHIYSIISYTNSFHILERNIVSLTTDCRIHTDTRAYQGNEETNFDKHIYNRVRT